MSNTAPRSFPNYVFSPYYFRNIDLGEFPDLIVEDQPIWKLIARIGPAIKTLLSRFPLHQKPPESLSCWDRPKLGGGIERVIYVEKGFVATHDTAIPEWGLFLGKGAILEPSAIIKSPAYIGTGSEVRQGAYLRGDTIIGSHCTVGHDTEVKASIFMGHTEAGHFAYVGDSILGKNVNLGAGTKLANLPFRTLEEKEAEAFPEMELQMGEQSVTTGCSKLGAILGDGVETGCNSTLAPGTFIGPDSWIYPCLYVPRGFYGARTILKSGLKLSPVPKR